MFANRYFAPRYFADYYWGTGGAVAPVADFIPRRVIRVADAEFYEKLRKRREASERKQKQQKAIRAVEALLLVLDY